MTCTVLGSIACVISPIESERTPSASLFGLIKLSTGPRLKVYTVNNESKYLLIQGVPAVGAGRELITLCAVYGAVEEYRILDDYPAAEKFTEVYWVKFSRIQSARFAKRKLDNQSFFGGVLHICYAPEYESVEETREKLQERRRIIANKTRQNETKTSLSESATEEVTSESHAEISGSEPVNITGEHKHGVNSYNNQQFHQSSTLPSGQMCNALIPTQIEPPYFTLQIPPPPQVMYAGGLPSQYQQREFDHARVPSSHATLPHGYDPRKHNPGFHELPPPAHFSPSQRLGSKHEDNTNGLQNNSVTCKTIELKNKRDINPNERKVDENDFEGGKATVPKNLVKGKGNDSTQIIVKDFKKSGAPPKFVPRQAMAAIKSKEKSGLVDKLGQQIRRNAVNLQEKMQGPALPDGSLQFKETQPPEVISVEKTVQEIRQKVTQFSEGQPLKKKLKPS